MSSFTRTGSDAFLAEFTRPEGLTLASLAEQLVSILTDESDPAAGRLFPDAYPDDPESAAEFRKYTLDGLTERKVHNARALMEAVMANPATTGPNGERAITLNAREAERWLRTLTDLRLTIATRLGITDNNEMGSTEEAAEPFQEIYYWLGGLQESIVNALEA